MEDAENKSALSRRLLFGTVITIVIVVAVMLDYVLETDMGFSTLVAFAAVFAILEFYRLAEVNGTKPARWFGAVSALLLVVGTRTAAAYHTRSPVVTTIFDPTSLVFVIMAALFARGIIFKQREEDVVGTTAVTLLGIVYVGFLSTFMLKIRGLPAIGLPAVVLVIAIAKIGDIAAYFCGTRFGKHKLAPTINPNKSIEGSAAGLAAGVLVAIVLCSVMPIEGLSLLIAIIFGLVVGISAQFGDLAESLIKRDTGAKDSSNLIPGFGGVLDIVDCLLICAPVAYLFLRLLGVGECAT